MAVGTLPLIIGATLVGSVATLVGASFVLLCSKGRSRIFIPFLVSYATGTLLGAAFLGMIPKALKVSSTTTVSATILAGTLLFFLLEKSVIWRHCHEDKCDIHTRAGTLIIFGDA